jgi:hypothetical protein
MEEKIIVNGFNLRLSTTIVASIILSSIFLIVPTTLLPSKATTFFSEDFEPDPLPGWTSTGYWHLIDDATDPCIGAPDHPSSSASPTHSYAYHIDATCDYDDGDINYGNLQSPTIDLSGTSVAYLHFKTWFSVIAGLLTEKMMVKISSDGDSWIQYAQISSELGDPMSFWYEKSIDISPFAGDSSIWIRFEFNTVLANSNDDPGWYIDDVRVDDTPPPPDILTVEAWNRAPATVEAAQTDVLMMQLNLTVNTNVVTLTSFDIDLSGLPPDSGDIDGAVLYLDENDNDIFEPGFGSGYDIVKSGTPFSAAPCPCSGTFNFLDGLTIYAGTTTSLFIAFNIDITVTIGNWIGASIADESYFTLEAPDIVAPFGGMDTYIPNERTEIVADSPGTLMVEGWNRAPAAVHAKENVLMLQLNLTVNANTAQVNSITVNLTGLPPDPIDIFSVNFCNDVNTNGVWEPSIDGLGTSVFPPFPVTYPTSLTVSESAPKQIFILFELRSTATVGNWIGVSMADNTSVTVAAPDVVSNANFPINTYSPTERTEIVPDILVVTHWQSNNPAIAYSGSEDNLMTNLTLEVYGDSVILESLKVDLKGSPTQAKDISSVKIFHDVNNNGSLEPSSDDLLGAGIFQTGSPPSATINLDTSGFLISGWTPEKLLILFDINFTAIVHDFVGVSILDEAYFNLPIGTIDEVSNLNLPIETSPDSEILFPKGDITGCVVDENNESIDGASIALYNNTGVEVNSTLTNETGYFTFLAVNETENPHSIIVATSFYETVTLDYVNVTRGLKVDIGTIELKTNATIKGKVIDEEGKGIGDALVILNHEEWGFINRVNTDSNGEYTFTGVEYGNYTIRANATGYEVYMTAENYSIDKDNLNLTIPDITLIAISEPPQDDRDFGNWWLIIIIIFIVVILIVIYFFARKRGKKIEDYELEKATENNE